MSKDYIAPSYASEVPVVPVDWQDRDTVTRRILDVIDAALPQGTQHDAISHLIKETTKQYWIQLFNDQYDLLDREYDPNMDFTIGSPNTPIRYKSSHAIWQATIEEFPDKDDGVPTEQKAKDLAETQI